MEKKNNIGNGILVVLLFIVICFLVYYIVIADKSNDKDIVDSDKIIVNDSLKNDVKSTIDKYLVNIFMEHSAKYCGQLDYDDIYDDVYGDNLMVYYRSKSFNSIEEIKKTYSSIVSDSFYNNNLSDMFLEVNGKLYCRVSPRGTLDYSTDNITLTLVEEDSGALSVKGYYKTTETEMSASETFNFEVSMVNNNNKWIIDSYQEI